MRTATFLDPFRHTLSGSEPPPGTHLALQALWWAGKGDWDRAHERAQADEGNPDCDWVHAFLHRQEGDLPNARYWYRRAGRVESAASLDDEWAAIAAELLARG